MPFAAARLTLLPLSCAISTTGRPGKDRRKTSHDVGGRGSVVDYVPLDDHDRKGLALFADHRTLKTHLLPLVLATVTTAAQRERLRNWRSDGAPD